MSGYKFVTREDIEGLFESDRWPIVERILAERDAYREVAAKIALPGVPFAVQNPNHGITVEDVDAEAARILEKK